MEAMDILLAAVDDLSYSLFNHPFYTILGSFAAGILLLRFYCRLTLGICESDQLLDGKTVLVTGATAGIGKATATEFARRNARVILACRNLSKAQKVAEEIMDSTGNRNVVVKHCDLASFSSVRKCAEDVLRTEERLDVLVNNAGIFSSQFEITEDGYEKVFQSNYLGHFLLTMLLLSLIKRSAPSRIINVASKAYNYGKLDLKNLKGESKESPFELYSKSKLANVLFTKELAARLSETGVTVNSLCPGMVKTQIIFQNGDLFAYFMAVIFFFLGKSCEEGAQTTINLAVNPQLEKTTGRHFVDCRETEVIRSASDQTLAKQLFAESEKIVGTSFSTTP